MHTCIYILVHTCTLYVHTLHTSMTGMWNQRFRETNESPETRNTKSPENWVKLPAHFWIFSSPSLLEKHPKSCSLCTIVCALMRCLTITNQFAHKEKLTEQERKECSSNMPPLCPPPSPASPRLTRVAQRWCLFALSRLSLHPPSPASLFGVVCCHDNAPPFPIFGNRSLKSNIATSLVVNSNVLQDVYRRW